MLMNRANLPPTPTHDTARYNCRAEQDWGHSHFLDPAAAGVTLPRMPRTARKAAGGVVYHVLNRSNGRQRLFHKPADYDAFVALLAGVKRGEGRGSGVLPGLAERLLTPFFGPDPLLW
jgi:hypothetical protein